MLSDVCSASADGMIVVSVFMFDRAKSSLKTMSPLFAVAEFRLVFPAARREFYLIREAFLIGCSNVPANNCFNTLNFSSSQQSSFN